MWKNYWEGLKVKKFRVWFQVYISSIKKFFFNVWHFIPANTSAQLPTILIRLEKLSIDADWNYRNAQFEKVERHRLKLIDSRSLEEPGKQIEMNSQNSAFAVNVGHEKMDRTNNSRWQITQLWQKHLNGNVVKKIQSESFREPTLKIGCIS